MDLREWLVSQGFEPFADGLDDDFDTLEELKGVTLKKLLKLGGTNNDHARLIQAVNNSLEQDEKINQSAQGMAHAQLLSRLPIFIAHPYDELVHEKHLRVKLNRLFDVAELIVRWTSAVLLSGVRSCHDGKLPPELAAKVREHIEKPSLGKWAGILRETYNACKQDAGELPAGLAEWVRWVGAIETASKKKKRLDEIVGNDFTPDRNLLAHSGGGSLNLCKKTYETHASELERLITGLATLLDGFNIIGIDSERIESLKGDRLTPLPDRPNALATCADGVWLLNDEGLLLELWPLIRHEALRTAKSSEKKSKPNGSIHPQCYIATKKGRTLTYLPIGIDEPCSYIEDDAFREFFQLDHKPVEIPLRRRFVELIKGEADQLVGRDEEVVTITAWLLRSKLQQGNEAKIGVIFGGPGLGKSLLMAKIVTDLDVPEDDHVSTASDFYFHRFRRGTEGNVPDDFYAGLLDALDAWPTLQEIRQRQYDELVLTKGAKDAEKAHVNKAMADKNKNVLQRAMERLEEIEAAIGDCPRFLIIIDGLDEVAHAYPDYPAELRKLALRGTTWLISTREEGKIPQQLIDGERVIAPTLQPMSSLGIRAMLESLPPTVKYALIQRDKDDTSNDHALPDNPFVEAVVDKAAGNPLYVHYLAQDLEDRKFEVTDERKLPEGLVKYYEDLMTRLGATDVGRALPLIVSLLAVADEPLSRESLSWLHGIEKGSKITDDAILAAGAMLRFALTPEGEEGFTLYHTHFRDYVLEPESPLSKTIQEARKILVVTAQDWENLPAGLRNHLFRFGNDYALRWGGGAAIAEVYERLTNFDYLMARLAQPNIANLNGLLSEYLTVRSGSSSELKVVITIWQRFFLNTIHILRRGTVRWPASRILLQRAVEHADDSLLTQSAERFLAQGKCDWIWLRDKHRPTIYRQEATSVVLEGHAATICGAQELPNGHILSWSDDRTFKIWDEQSGECLFATDGHQIGYIDGATILSCGHLLSWSNFDGLQIWDENNGQCLADLSGTTAEIHGLPVLPDGRVFSCSSCEILIWDQFSGTKLAAFSGHTAPINGIRVLPENRLLSWSQDLTVRIWDTKSGECLCMVEQDGRHGEIENVEYLTGDKIVSFSEGNLRSVYDDPNACPRMTIYDARSGVCLSTFEWQQSHNLFFCPDGNFLTIENCHTRLDLQKWDALSGARLITFLGHTGDIRNIKVVSDNIIVSRARDGTRLWDYTTGVCLAVLDWPCIPFEPSTPGEAFFSGNRVCLWAHQDILIIDLLRDSAQTALSGHKQEVSGVKPLSGNRLVSWSRDGTLRIWNDQNGVCLTVLEGHTGPVVGIHVLSDNRILSWSEDCQLRIWDDQNGECLAVLEGHTGPIVGIHVLSDNRILSWSADCHLRIWDALIIDPVPLSENSSVDKKEILKFQGFFGFLLLSDFRLLSISSSCIRLWDCRSGACLAVLTGHTGPIQYAIILKNDHVLSWGGDEASGFEMRLWDSRSGACLSIFSGHVDSLADAELLPNGFLLTVGKNDPQPRLWDCQNGACLAVLSGHTKPVTGVILLSQNRILSWAEDLTLRIWDGQSGACLAVLSGHAKPVTGVILLSQNRILSWAEDLTLRIWDDQSGACSAVFVGHTESLVGVCVLSENRILSWAYDQTLRIWDIQSSGCEAVLEARNTNYLIHRAFPLDESRILFYEEEGLYVKTLRIWDSQNGACLSVEEVQNAKEALMLFPHNRMLLTGSGRAEFRDSLSGNLLVSGREILPLSEDRVLSWDPRSSELKLWDISNDALRVIDLKRHTSNVKGVRTFQDGRIFSWAEDLSMCIWDQVNGECFRHWQGAIGQLFVRADPVLQAVKDLVPFLILPTDPDWSEEALPCWAGDVDEQHEIIGYSSNGLVMINTAPGVLHFVQAYRGSKQIGFASEDWVLINNKEGQLVNYESCIQN